MRSTVGRDGRGRRHRPSRYRSKPSQRYEVCLLPWPPPVLGASARPGYSQANIAVAKCFTGKAVGGAEE